MTRYGSESGAEALRNQETPCVHSLSLRGPGIESGKSRSLFPLSCLRTNNIVGREGEGGEGDGESC